MAKKDEGKTRRRRKTESEKTETKSIDDTSEAKEEDQNEEVQSDEIKSESEKSAMSDIPKHQFAGMAQMYEEKSFFIRAKNQVDAKELLSQNLQSQDKVISLIGVSGGYRVKIEKFIGRDFPV